MFVISTWLLIPLLCLLEQNLRFLVLFVVKLSFKQLNGVEINASVIRAETRYKSALYWIPLFMKWEVDKNTQHASVLTVCLSGGFIVTAPRGSCCDDFHAEILLDSWHMKLRRANDPTAVKKITFQEQMCACVV